MQSLRSASQMHKARAIISNTAAQVLGKVATALLGIISVKLITNYLSQTQYGEYTAIYDYVAIFAILADFGLFTIAVREMANDDKRIEQIVGNVLSVRTIFAITSIGLGILIAFLLPQYRDSFIPLGAALVGVATILALIGGTISSVLQYHLKMHWSALALSVGKALTVAYIAIVILRVFPSNPEAGFYHLLVAWIVGNLFVILLTYIPSRKLMHIKYRFDWQLWKEVIFKSLPYGLALVLGTVYFRIDSVILSLFGLKEELGIYGVAMRMLEILVIIPAYFMNSILPLLTRALKDARERVGILLQFAFNFMNIAALPMLVGGFFLAEAVIALISSPAFLTGYHCTVDPTLIFYSIDSAAANCPAVDMGETNSSLAYFFRTGSDTALRLVLFAMFFTYLHAIFTFSLVALGAQIRLLWINLGVVAFNIISNIIVIPYFGFVGAAVTTIISDALVLVFAYIAVKRLVQFTLNFDLWWKIFGAASVMGLCLFFATPYVSSQLGFGGLVALIPAGALVYVGALYAFGGLNKRFLEELKGIR